MNHSPTSNTSLQKLGDEVISIIYIFAVISSLTLCLDLYVNSSLSSTDLDTMFLYDSSFYKALNILVTLDFLMFWTYLLGIIWFTHKSQLYNFDRGIQDLKYSANWVGIWWLIPFLNLWMPLRVVRETYLSSFQEKKNKLGSNALQTFLGWWGCWVIALITNGLTNSFYGYNLYEVAITLSTISSFFFICSALSFVGIIKSIYSNQLETSQNKL
tara:strand:+ start:172 stop:813 length:642 start_codon:yes stop_codon:yes gene_type:complete